MYASTDLTLLSAGLKYHDTTVNIKSSNAGKVSTMLSPTAMCENIAPVMIKKNPAYAHSFTRGNLGTSNAITPNIFQTPSIGRMYAG